MTKAAATVPPAGEQSQPASGSLAVVHWCVLIVVLIAPLPFASVLAWAWAPLAALIGLVLLGWAILLAVNRAEIQVSPAKLAVPGVLFAGTVIWILVQIAPFTPPSWHHPVWSAASAALKTHLAGSITVDTYKTASALLRLLWYASIFWLALQTGRANGTARRAFNALALAAFAYAVYGLIVEFSGAGMVLWVEKYAYRDSLTSTFINRNSYAAYAGIGLICLTAMIARKLAHSGIRGLTLGTRLANAINMLFAQSWYLTIAWLVVLTALILANSRAGLISSVLGLFAFLGSLTFSRGVSRRAAVRVVIVTIVAVFAVFLVSGDLVSKRMARIVEQPQARLVYYELTIKAIGDSPILGTGYGTFAQVFQLYRTDNPLLRTPPRKAHNTYLENALELGIPAASALTLSIASLVILCFLGVRRRRRDAFYPAVGVGVSILVGLHSLVDFSLQTPAIAATYAFIMGVACAQSWSSREQVGIGRDQTS